MARESPVLTHARPKKDEREQPDILLLAERVDKTCSSDARNKGQSGCSPGQSGGNLNALARVHGSSRRARGVVGENVARSGGLIRVIPGNVHQQAWKDHLWSSLRLAWTSASLGEEAALADSGREGEITAGLGG